MKPYSNNQNVKLNIFRRGLFANVSGLVYVSLAMPIGRTSINDVWHAFQVIELKLTKLNICVIYLWFLIVKGNCVCWIYWMRSLVFAIHINNSLTNPNIFYHDDVIKWKQMVPCEFPAQRPVTRDFDISFDLRLNTPLRMRSGGWWVHRVTETSHAETMPTSHWVFCMIIRNFLNMSCSTILMHVKCQLKVAWQ